MRASYILFAIPPLVLGPLAEALRVPANVQNFMTTIKSRAQCTNKLATGFYSTDDGPNTFSYCGDYLVSAGVVYLQGTKGNLADMDVDCDGTQGGPADDGRCGSSRDTQAQTSFKSIVQSYRKGVSDLDSNIHTYVVFGNEGTRRGWKTFDPRLAGIEPLSVMAVVCNNKMFYGVWGDTNGDDGDLPMVGEASLSLATACFGRGMTGDNGHSENDVLYIGFRGKDAVPGANGAKWAARTPAEFHTSIQALGDKLVKRIPG